MSGGWIKIHRDILDWEWFGDNFCFKVFMYIILKANHEDNNWKGISIKRGQLVTGRGKISSDCGISEMSVRTTLDRLKSTGEINIKTTNHYSIITVNNYDKFQSVFYVDQKTENTKEKPKEKPKEKVEKQSEILSGEKDIFGNPIEIIEPKKTSTAELNAQKNKQRKDIASLEEIQEYAKTKKMTIDPVYFFDSMESCGWVLKNKNRVKDWKATMRTWESNSIKWKKERNRSSGGFYKTKAEKSDDAIDSLLKQYENGTSINDSDEIEVDVIQE